MDETPEGAALLRWKEGEFLQVERAVARQWRAELEALDPDRMIGVLKNILPPGAKVSDLRELKAAIDAICASNEREVIALALDTLGVPDATKWIALGRWEVAGRPRLDTFAPYTTHVFKVDLLYYLGVDRGFISGERPGNKVDVAYLYYLPFSMVFVSGDKLHHRTAPLFLTAGQSYVQSDELKAALGELDRYFEGLPEEIKELGVLQFATFPPSTIDNTVTQLWDKHMRPDWRDVARSKEAELGEPRDEAQEHETLEEIKERLRQAQPVVGIEAQLSGDAPDYVAIRRQIPVKKGKWRMVSKETEEAESEE
jgi:hypothetical protein